MRKNFLFLILFIVFLGSSQSKKQYLEANRYDMLQEDFIFPATDFNMIGFGAYHGSARTYEAEFILIKSLKEQNLLDYYLPEMSFSQAFFFQKYLENGDEYLLKKLVLSYQAIVVQEGSVETFLHWKNLRKLNQNYLENPIKVIGFDIINDYEFPIKHLVYLTENVKFWKEKEVLEKLLLDEDTDFSIKNEQLKNLLKAFIESYRKDKENKDIYINNVWDFNFILKNIEDNFQEERDREKIIYENYLLVKNEYQLGNKKQFAKYGAFHIQKEQEEDYPSFFTRLIQNHIYKKDKVITVMGYLTKSKVLWDKIYDKKGSYKSFTIKRGFGIGDYWNEYFKGIKYLKKAKLSDITLFRINAENSPYHFGSDLVEVKHFLKNSQIKLRNKNTTDFIDYAILIRNSENQKPIELIK